MKKIILLLLLPLHIFAQSKLGKLIPAPSQIIYKKVLVVWNFKVDDSLTMYQGKLYEGYIYKDTGIAKYFNTNFYNTTLKPNYKLYSTIVKDSLIVKAGDIITLIILNEKLR